MAFADKAAASKYVYQYTKDKYDRVNLLLPKGAKEQIKAAADASGVSVNELIKQAIANHVKGYCTKSQS